MGHSTFLLYAMSSLQIWNPTLCSLQLAFSRLNGSSSPIEAGSTYQGTSVIRYRLESLTEHEMGINPNMSKDDGGVVLSSSSSPLSEYEEFLQHRRVIAMKRALHLHALTTASGLYKDSMPLQVMSYQVNGMSTSSSVGGGKTGALKVLSVEQEDANAVVALSSQNSKGSAATSDKKQKNKWKPNKKGGNAASEEESNTNADGSSVDWGSKLVRFEGADTLPLYSEVELTVSFKGAVQSFDHGGIYAAKTENTKDSPLLTHLEVRFARCAFPCPDDPQYRLIWQLKSIHLPDSYITVLTNGDEEGRKELKAHHAVQWSFSPCGPLPAYIFSFACFPEQLERVEVTVDIPEFTADVAHGLKGSTGTLSCITVPVRVLARRQARISLSTLQRVLHITLDAIAALQRFFDCPFPVLQCRHVDILLGPTMPFISGMEHHCSIILNETIYTSTKKAAAGGGVNAETEQTELILHELAHHWMGNALGLPFAVKEGICQVLEQCVGDTLMGKPMRRFKADITAGNGEPAASISPSGNTTQASEKGHEFTGASYQQALSAIKRFVAERGFEAFGSALQRLVHTQVVLPTIAVEERGGMQTLRCISSGDVPSPPYVCTEAFLRSMEPRYSVRSSLSYFSGP